MRSACRDWESLSFVPGRAGMVGSGRPDGGWPARVSSRVVSSKERRAPSWRAAARRTRRRRAGSSGLRRSSSIESDCSPGAVELERPPPRTGLPGRMSCGRMRASSACQRDSSSRANSATLARVVSMLGFSSRRAGSRVARMRLRVKASTEFEESSRQGWWRASEVGAEVFAAGGAGAVGGRGHRGWGRPGRWR